MEAATLRSKDLNLLGSTREFSVTIRCIRAISEISNTLHTILLPNDSLHKSGTSLCLLVILCSVLPNFSAPTMSLHSGQPCEGGVSEFLHGGVHRESRLYGSVLHGL